MTAVFRILSLIILFSLGVVACGDGDSGSEPAMDSGKAEGVIYQDEIYANWPYN